MKFSREKGLTIFELLVVIAVLVLLAIFITLNIPPQIAKARDARRKVDLEKIKTALYDYYFDADCFPKELPGCEEDFGSSSMVYLNNFPCDPKGINYAYEVEDGECSQWFKILTNLENTQDLGIDKVGCRGGCGPECRYNYGLASTNIRVNKDCVAYYACAPGGECTEFEDPFISDCPQIFENDFSCGEVDCGAKENWCHDSRGKKTPED